MYIWWFYRSRYIQIQEEQDSKRVLNCENPGPFSRLNPRKEKALLLLLEGSAILKDEILLLKTLIELSVERLTGDPDLNMMEAYYSNWGQVFLNCFIKSIRNWKQKRIEQFYVVKNYNVFPLILNRCRTSINESWSNLSNT